MNRNSYDRRIKKTDNAIRSAYLELLEQKGDERLTVKELCETADVNRSTFYLHYTGIEELRVRIEEELYEEYLTFLEALEKEHTAWIDVLIHNDDAELMILKETFNFIKSNRQILATFFRSSHPGEFLTRFYDSGQTTYLKLIRSLGVIDEKIALYHYDFVASGILGLIRRWVEGGMKESPQEMMRITETLIRFGSAGLIKEIGGIK